MRFLASIRALAIIAAIAGAIYFFGGFYNVGQTANNPAIVDWALASARGASVVAHRPKRRRPISTIPRR